MVCVTRECGAGALGRAGASAGPEPAWVCVTVATLPFGSARGFAWVAEDFGVFGDAGAGATVGSAAGMGSADAEAAGGLGARGTSGALDAETAGPPDA